MDLRRNYDNGTLYAHAAMLAEDSGPVVYANHTRADLLILMLLTNQLKRVPEEEIIHGLIGEFGTALVTAVMNAYVTHREATGQ